MMTRRSCFWLGCFNLLWPIAISTSGFAGDETSAKLANLFSTNQIEVQPFEVTGSEEMERIAATLQKSIRENFLWYREYVVQNENAKPLPYHSNFGISEAEYKAFLTEIKKGITLAPIGKPFAMRIVKNGDLITFEEFEKTQDSNDPEPAKLAIGIRKLLTLTTINVKTTDASVLRVELGGSKWSEGEGKLLGKFKGFGWKVEDDRLVYFEDLPENTVAANIEISMLYSDKWKKMCGNYRVRTGDREGIKVNLNVDFWFSVK